MRHISRGTNKFCGSCCSDFALEAARSTAEDALLGQTVIRATPDAYATFLARLDAPPQPNEHLHKIMQSTLPWKVK
ncbi:type II toxin-antitoxin system TacA family antitoxin [Acidocella aromatica]|uniref:type II toxin-antitoxin system TacA family antitoxin n=1 Tax=Acidocella aromatica TaxID=1303579 RepID=UPI001C848DAF